MNVPDDVLAAIGGIAVESVWVEIVAASMSARGLEDAMRLAGRPGAALAAARKTVGELADEDLRREATKWINQAQALLETVRHPIVHGLAHYDEHRQWHAVHLRSGDVRPLNPESIDADRQRLDHHAGDGWRIAHRIWTQRPADSVRTDEG
ncbi:hypothetical protein [Nocardioides xinjiangensis]|uniref:hypothetical protein n=1 Tax=Nocardioides xinjiangensis TaxID=2817376 RepID=UPI001B3015BB|nr:hypothetical protein [Nocardioides sp. SYSU D00514]